jgi:hypothetical protein
VTKKRRECFYELMATMRTLIVLPGLCSSVVEIVGMEGESRYNHNTTLQQEIQKKKKRVEKGKRKGKSNNGVPKKKKEKKSNSGA